MKKLLFILITINCFAQAPAVEWLKTYGGSEGDTSYSIIQTNDGGYISCGYTTSCDGDIVGNHSCGEGNADLLVFKIDVTGSVQWTKSIGGTGTDFARSIVQLNDGNYVIGGTASSNDGDITNNDGHGDFLAVKIDQTGNILWQKTYGGSGVEEAAHLEKTTDNGFIMCGLTTSSNNGDVSGAHGDYDFWVAKIDNQGTLQWQKALGGSNGDQAKCVIQDTDGGYIVAGYTTSSDGDVTSMQGCYDAWIVKLTPTGQIQWQKSLGDNGCEMIRSIRKTPDNGFIAFGHKGYKAWVVKLTADANIEWQKTYGGTQLQNAESISLTPDGGYIFCGNTFSSNGDLLNIPGNGKAWIVKLDAAGIIQWQKKIGGSDDDYFNSIMPTADGGYIVSGEAFSSDGDITASHGYIDFLMVKLAPDPLSNATFQYENLVVFLNPTTNLLDVKTPNNDIIDQVLITDLSGKTIIRQTQNTNLINTQNLASGIYFLQATSNHKTYQTKFIKQ
ncbi:T9SS type A sorting domain-containing protein [Flavobacterium sp.]|uniref:T9SS type A sorting domain-containing protein n=1 Tax=Flavobacterium sp. TaxID=239 RepID=UPI00286AF8BE|nr:T9SS type A sorting domain-containing protein [Flavobacterium sp.]